MSHADDWADTLIDMAYGDGLDADAHCDALDLVNWYLAEASQSSLSADAAKLALQIEILDIAPVTEPFKDVVRRVLRHLPCESEQ